MGYGLVVFQQALNNPRTSTTLNEWMDTRLGTQLQTQLEPRFKEIEGRFNEISKETDARFKEMSKEMDARFKEMETKLNSERQYVAFLERHIQTLEEKNRTLENQLHQYLPTPAVNKAPERVSSS